MAESTPLTEDEITELERMLDGIQGDNEDQARKGIVREGVNLSNNIALAEAAWRYFPRLLAGRAEQAQALFDQTASSTHYFGRVLALEAQLTLAEQKLGRVEKLPQKLRAAKVGFADVTAPDAFEAAAVEVERALADPPGESPS